MEIRPLVHLAAIVEHKNFVAASRALGISQPALSKSIQKLERELGAPVLDESRRGVSLTAIGSRVVERAASLVQGAAELQREVDLLRGLEIGSLSIGVGPAMSESFVPEAIARLAERMPRAHIRVRVDHWTQLSEWLHEGRLDLYVADITEAAADERVEIVRMPSQQLVWFCRKGHPLAKAPRVTRAVMLQFPIATPRMPKWAVDWLSEAGLPRSEGTSSAAYNTIECENHSVLKAIVMQSDCISAALEATVVREVEQGSIVVLPVKGPSLKTAAGVVHLKDRMLSPIAEAFVCEVAAAAESVRKQKRKSAR